MAMIGYTCSYTPVELLSATGFHPYRLLHGDPDLIRHGERWLRVDACPLVRANLGYLLKNQKEFAAVVGSTGCDMARRMLDVVGEICKLPVYIINTPRTDRPQIYYDEVDWLVKELEHLSDKKFDDDLIGREIERWERARGRYRVYDQRRWTPPSLLSTASFHKLAVSYHQGNINVVGSPSDESAGLPRVVLLGSPVSFESTKVLNLIEKSFRIIWDFNCGISRFLNIRIEERNLDGLKKAYYQQPPCIYKRPNSKYYDFVQSKIKELDPVGIIVFTLDYCDNYEFELKRMERKFGLPMLRLRSDFSFQGVSQLKTRIEAFKEMLDEH